MPFFQEGTFVDNRSENGFKVQLYRLHSFYVEVFYDAQANKILQYRSFNSITQLAPYIRSVQ
jgi:abortive infection bacteriophage resistance protein